MSQSASKHTHQGCCTCVHEHAPDVNAPKGSEKAGDHAHAALKQIDHQALGKASTTRTLYRIRNIDYTMEEALIRKKLTPMPGVTGLKFNLAKSAYSQSYAAIYGTDSALQSIDMPPEPIHLDQGAVAVFSRSGMSGRGEPH